MVQLLRIGHLRTQAPPNGPCSRSFRFDATDNPESRKNANDVPARIDLAATLGETGCPGPSMVVIVQALSGGYQGQDTEVRRRVRKVFVAHGVAQGIDARSGEPIRAYAQGSSEDRLR